MRVDRAGRAAHVDKPALSFGLLLQPDVLADVASSRRFRASGLLARFLYAMPASNVGRRDVRRHSPIPNDVRDNYARHIFGLLEGVPGPLAAPKLLPLSDAARDVWLDLAEEIEHQQGDGGRYESISDWTGKLPGAVARIAGLLELAEMGLGAEEVSQAAMERALRLGTFADPACAGGVRVARCGRRGRRCGGHPQMGARGRVGAVHEAGMPEGPGGAVPQRRAVAESVGPAGASGRGARIQAAEQGGAGHHGLSRQSTSSVDITSCRHKQKLNFSFLINHLRHLEPTPIDIVEGA